LCTTVAHICECCHSWLCGNFVYVYVLTKFFLSQDPDARVLFFFSRLGVRVKCSSILERDPFFATETGFGSNFSETIWSFYETETGFGYLVKLSLILFFTNHTSETAKFWNSNNKNNYVKIGKKIVNDDKIIFWTTAVMFVWIWHVWSTFTVWSSLHSCMFVYIDNCYHGNAVSRDPFVQWNRSRFHCETKTSFNKWITLLVGSWWRNCSAGCSVSVVAITVELFADTMLSWWRTFIMTCLRWRLMSAQCYALVVVHATIGLACCHHLMAVVAWWHNLYGTRLVA